ncbi:monofunctional biosynthetic peptidoglycan transglycosylase [Pseudahrensia aquimaris]|uniref:Biosynthetic peptidoglycan transglycosylase n=1 Tax=Pseudahrensia aquimaris TaxID=744461 RepID=A0ABW3FBT0_9HYPH
MLRRPSGVRGWLWWAIKRLAIVAAILIAIPVFLTLIYKPTGVRPVSTLMLAERVSGEPVRRDWVAFEDISPVLWQSVMMSEDGQFCAHDGVDWAQVNLVLDDVLEGEKVRGASTISMQTVKNLYLWSSRSYIRKVLEVPLAMMVDFVWGKKRVMEVYLNIAEWGPGIYGIEAAAQHHFSRSAKRLSRRQAALLAVTLPNPKLRNPRKPSRGMNRLARLVERRARASGAYIGCLR